jgi:CRISPR/Cas system endoribonuclease Cas6 (RAMP superfamily)
MLRRFLFMGASRTCGRRLELPLHLGHPYPTVFRRHLRYVSPPRDTEVLHSIFNRIVVNQSMGLLGDMLVPYPPHLRDIILHDRV